MIQRLWQYGLLSVALTTSAWATAAEMSPIALTHGVTVERDLLSTNGQYLFLVRTGTWQINGTLFNRANNQAMQFTGTQKGYVVSLSANNKEFIFNGTLDLAKNRIDGVMTTDQQQAITFEPYIPVAKRPAFQFKFFGNNGTVKQIKIYQNRQLVQTIQDIDVLSDGATYADDNFDGYFDLRLNLPDQRHQFWLYQPQTGKFQYDRELSQLQGEVRRYPEKMILRVGNTLLERRGNQWNNLPCCGAVE